MNTPFTIVIGILPQLFAHKFDFSNIAKINAFALYGTDFKGFQRSDIMKFCIISDIGFRAVFLDMSGRQFDIGAVDPLNDRSNTQAAFNQFFPVKDHMELHLIATVDSDFSNAADTGKFI